MKGECVVGQPEVPVELGVSQKNANMLLEIFLIKAPKNVKGFGLKLKEYQP